jgi:hypothetical protein
MATRQFYQVGFQPDVVGDYFAEIHKNYKGDPKREVQEFNNSETRLSLLKIDNRTQAFVIETRSDFNDLEFILGDVEVKTIESGDVRLFKMMFKQWFENNDYNYVQFQIHRIETVLNRIDEIEATITLGRPSLLIGKAGRTIQDLTDFMNRVMDKKVVIKIKEYDPWN